ncbi:MAG: TIGR00725 family protein [Synergistetes bacterium]|nr:TIGR00725 family protein [Synergistota bacterium]MCX8128135.1 TIGR00725 family protein [Synergistota bacterium]MDW8192511.1 TIGR00725 family protein [Synergistota bacterium]
MEKKLYVGVIGGGYNLSQDVEDSAIKMGRLIAREGWVTLCGGRGGIMEAVAKGVYQEGGVVIGILPGSSRDEGNPYLTYAIPTALGHFRNFIIAQASDILVAFEGEYGTLSEIAIGLRLEKPVVSLAGWELKRRGFEAKGIYEASSPEDAIRLIKEILKVERR